MMSYKGVYNWQTFPVKDIHYTLKAVYYMWYILKGYMYFWFFAMTPKGASTIWFLGEKREGQGYDDIKKGNRSFEKKKGSMTINVKKVRIN